jgi:aminotransferase
MAACEALHAGKSFVEEMKREYARRREFVIDGLNSIGLTCHKPQGAFYAFPSIRKTGLKSLDFAQKLLKDEKVAVVPGTAFGAKFEDYIRISYASSFDNLKEALRRMGAFLKKQS